MEVLRGGSPESIRPKKQPRPGRRHGRRKTTPGRPRPKRGRERGQDAVEAAGRQRTAIPRRARIPGRRPPAGSDVCCRTWRRRRARYRGSTGGAADPGRAGRQRRTAPTACRWPVPEQSNWRRRSTRTARARTCGFAPARAAGCRVRRLRVGWRRAAAVRRRRRGGWWPARTRARDFPGTSARRDRGSDLGVRNIRLTTRRGTGGGGRRGRIAREIHDGIRADGNHMLSR